MLATIMYWLIPPTASRWLTSTPSCHAITRRLIAGYFCIFLTPHNKVIRKLSSAQSTVMLSSLLLGHFGSLGVMELWIGFGTGKAFQHIPVHEITQTLGSEKSLSCPLFHSFTWCDMTSSFLGIGKKTAWAAWQVYPDLTETLLTVSDDPTLLTLESIHIARLERWTRAVAAQG